MPKRKTSSGPQTYPDCSDAAQILIARMQSDPEDFRGYESRFRDLLDAAQRSMHNPTTASPAYQMSRRDAAAIMEAAEKYLFEPWLMERVLTTLTTVPESKQEKQGGYIFRAPDPRQLYSNGGLVGAQGAAITGSIYSPSNTVSNTGFQATSNGSNK